jgi:hypothetical protein
MVQTIREAVTGEPNLAARRFAVLSSTGKALIVTCHGLLSTISCQEAL